MSGGVSGFEKGSYRGASDGARILEAKEAERRRRGSGYNAPILHRIVNGTSATSLNLIALGASGDGETRLFKKGGLYSTILYKYPNFTKGDRERPVETALYVPHDAAEPMKGGYGIYLRRASHRGVLKEMLGLDMAGDDPDLKADLRLLDILDEVPSLDPFLVRARFEFHDLPLGDGHLRTTETEHEGMRRIVQQRIGLILRHAAGARASEAKILRALEAIWNPRMEESALFMAAFGIRPEEAPKIFFALQGITFYEHASITAREGMELVGAWLRGPGQRPDDLDLYPRYDRERLVMLREMVAKGLATCFRHLSTTFTTYDLALKTFTVRDDAAPMREFLQRANERFWRIGFSLSAVLNAEAIVERVMQTPGTASKFLNVLEALQQLHAAVNDEATGHLL
ncbi:MAG: hypothetical protein ACK5WM_05220 [Rhodospirillales bacterium]